MVADGAGGAVVAYADDASGLDIHAQRMGGDGSVQWGVNGVPVCTAPGNQGTVRLVDSGFGTFIVAWDDQRSGVGDVYAQSLTSSGATRWATDGVAITTAIGSQYYPTMVPDGAGGAILAWYDQRAGGTVDIYGQRVERFGVLGNPEPAILGVADVPGDQGGRVLIEWTASYLDVYPMLEVAQYSVWRRVPSGAAAARASRDAHAEGAAVPAARLSDRPPRTTIESGQTIYWEHVADLPARAFPGYSYVAPTTVDSTAGSNPLTSYMVMAEAPAGGAFWASASASGYSVDDLAPAAPAPFTGIYAAGFAHLHWPPNTEADLAGYRLYRGSDPGFPIGPGTLVANLPDTGHVDHAGAPYVYKLTALDVHGNESPAVALVPAGAAAVGEEGRTAFGIERLAPNPAAGGTGLTIRFGLPSGARARLDVHDVQGRRVRTLVDAALAAGDHAARLDGRDETGRRLAAGVYLVTLTAGGARHTRTLVLVD
jgi:hypothetical protein